MQRTTTSIELPPALKARIEALAADAGQSPQAFIIAALQSCVDDLEKYQRLIRDATVADTEMVMTGRGFDFIEARTFLEARMAGKRAARPRQRA